MAVWWTDTFADGAKGPWTDNDIIRFVQNGYLQPTDRLRMEGQQHWLPMGNVFQHIKLQTDRESAQIESAVVNAIPSINPLPSEPIVRFPAEVMQAMHQCLVSLFSRKSELIDYLCGRGLDLRIHTSELTTKGLSDLATSAISIMERHQKGDELFNSLLITLLRMETLTDWKAAPAINHTTAMNALDALRRAHHTVRNTKQNRRFSEIEHTERQHATEQRRKVLLRELLYLATAVPKYITAQQRGYQFEKLLHSIFQLEDIVATGPARTSSQQHDNRIEFLGENYLIEAKWHHEPIGTREVNHFHSKVDGVFYGRGLFVSMSGFATGLVADVMRGKAIKLILFDHLDVTAALEGRTSFVEMLKGKLLAAQTLGHIYFDTIDNATKPN